jgi:5'-3' exonuclease
MSPTLRLHVVDGTWELFRAHFSKRPGHRTPEGQQVKATVGLASSLLALLHDEAEAVSHIGVAFDNPIRSFRNDLFEGYKSDEGVPEELRCQFDLAEQVVVALGVRVWSMDRFEADDALASAASRFCDEVDQVRIMACDKDLLQCVRDQRVVMVDRQRSKTHDEAMVRKDRGVAPAAIPDLLALTGDEADGIPGLPGFGARTAAALLDAFGHLEDIPPEASAWPKAVRGAVRLAATFREEREQALLYRRLATLVTEVDVGPSLDALAFHGVPREQWHSMCERLGLTTLAQRPTRWAG